MTTRLIAIAATTLFLVGPAAFAATAPTADTCASLEKQWDAAVAQHSTAAKITEAKKLAEEAVNYCKAKNFHESVAKYEAAFKDIGVTPKM